MKKRLLAILVSVCMLVSVPLPVLAADAASTTNAGMEIAAKEEPKEDQIQSEEKDEKVTGIEAEEASAVTKLNIYTQDDSGDMSDWVIDGKVTNNMPGSCKFNASTLTLTIKNINQPSKELWIVYGDDYAFEDKNIKQLKINLIGTSAFSSINAGSVKFYGNGTLNANQLYISDLAVDGGAFNLKVKEEYNSAIYTKSFTVNGGTINISSSVKGYGISGHYADDGNVNENSFHFLGGSVNIKGNIIEAIDVGSGNMDVYNAAIDIDQDCSEAYYGIQCGSFDGSNSYGGTINLKNADIVIKAKGFTTEYDIISFSRLNDLSNNHSYYDGIVGPQYKYQFSEAFNTSFTLDDGTVIYEKSLDSALSKQRNYFRITYKDVPLIHDPAFTDVTDPSNSYYDAIYWAADNNITTGYSDGSFGIKRNCSRGAFVTFLWRQQGSPEPTLTAEKSGLKDFGSIGKSYQKAVLWAVENGITTGYKDKTFRAGANVTRGAAVTFLYRATGEPKVSITRNDVTFTDMVPAGSSYETGILWAVENKITTGYKDNTFRPGNNCVRGATVTFLQRFDALQ